MLPRIDCVRLGNIRRTRQIRPTVGHSYREWPCAVKTVSIRFSVALLPGRLGSRGKESIRMCGLTSQMLYQFWLR